MNDPNCGLAEPCIADVITTAIQCSNLKQTKCSVYTSCLECVGNQNPVLNCYWCDDGSGNRYCDSSCNNGATKIKSCSIFGPTTTGYTISNTGATGLPSTGSLGNGPSGYTPGGSGPPSTPTEPVGPTSPGLVPGVTPDGQPTTQPGFVQPGTTPNGQPTTVPAPPPTTPNTQPTEPVQPVGAPSEGYIYGFEFVLFAVVVVISLILG